MEYTARTFNLPTIRGLSEKQLTLHLGLYEGYVKHVNLLMQQMNDLASHGDAYGYAINELRRRLGFEWNGMRLHELYFEALEGGSTTLLANSELYKLFEKQYGSFSEWFDIFTKVSARGPGWSLLLYDAHVDRLIHTWVADHEVGQLASLPVILAVDHWEHAYLIDYTPAEKAAYVNTYLNAINWEVVAKRVTRTDVA